MIGCDVCERWYHGPCVGVAKAQADAMDEYVCPECAKTSGKKYAFGPPIPTPKRTRRPRLRYVTTLLGEAEEIGVEMAEVGPMAALQEKAENWQVRAADLLEVEAGVTLEAAAVCSLLAEGEELEVEPESVSLSTRHTALLVQLSTASLTLRGGPERIGGGTNRPTSAPQ